VGNPDFRCAWRYRRGHQPDQSTNAVKRRRRVGWIAELPGMRRRHIFHASPQRDGAILVRCALWVKTPVRTPFVESIMSSKQRLTTFKKLDGKRELGISLGRLMIALNDIGIANDGLGSWMKDQEGIRKDRQQGAKMYFVRMLISHVFE